MEGVYWMCTPCLTAPRRDALLSPAAFAVFVALLLHTKAFIVSRGIKHGRKPATP
jgi:hypothetical protein